MSSEELLEQARRKGWISQAGIDRVNEASAEPGFDMRDYLLREKYLTLGQLSALSGRAPAAAEGDTPARDQRGSNWAGLSLLGSCAGLVCIVLNAMLGKAALLNLAFLITALLAALAGLILGLVALALGRRMRLILVLLVNLAVWALLIFTQVRG